jgi:hypothetical protein
MGYAISWKQTSFYFILIISKLLIANNLISFFLGNILIQFSKFNLIFEHGKIDCDDEDKNATFAIK